MPTIIVLSKKSENISNVQLQKFSFEAEKNVYNAWASFHICRLTTRPTRMTSVKLNPMIGVPLLHHSEKKIGICTSHVSNPQPLDCYC